MPAAFASEAIGPISRSTRSTTASTSAADVTSATKGRTSSPASSAAGARASGGVDRGDGVAVGGQRADDGRPIPPAAPVTMVTGGDTVTPPPGSALGR